MAQVSSVPVGTSLPYKPARRPIKYYLGRVLFYLVVLLIVVYTIFPFYWAINTSLKPAGELFITPVSYWPKNLTLNNYRQVFDNDNFVRAIINSAIVATATTLIALVLGSFAAYALGRINFRGRSPVLYIILSMTMFPAIAVLGSMYEMVRRAGLFNTLWALIITYLLFTLPFTVWVLTNFFKAMPRELEEASLVDGATPFKTYYQILLPLAAPGLVTTGLLAFIAAWNEYLFALTFTITANKRTVPYAIASFGGQSDFELPWGQIMAASVVVTIPLIIMVLIFQRRIIAGLTAGSVKG